MMQTDNDNDNDNNSISEEEISIYSTSSKNSSRRDEEEQHGNAAGANATNAPSVVIAEAEEKAVFRLRLVVLTVLIASTIGVAIAVYTYVKHSERTIFEETFQEDAIKILNSIGSSLDLTMGAIDALVVSLVSHAQYSNSTWPFVTVPNWGIRASKIKSLSNAVYLNIYPIVTIQNRFEWEAYTIQNDDWVNETIYIQSTDDTFPGPLTWNWTQYGTIHGDYYDRPYNISTYLPIWQSYPVVSDGFPPYNWDLLGVYDTRSLTAIFKSHKVVLSEAYYLPQPDNEIELDEAYWSDLWFSDFIYPNEDPSEPKSDLYYPIIDTVINSVRIPEQEEEQEDNDENNFVGILALSIFWRDVIKEILPPGSNGLVVVFENECNPTFTYQIDGPTVTYLGRGDNHDTKYNHLEVSSWLLDLSDYSTSSSQQQEQEQQEEGNETTKAKAKSKSSYTGIPLDDNFCPFYIRIFPSDDMKNDHTTNNHKYFTAGVVIIFVFNSFIFLLYDYLVERRQHTVHKKAVHSSAIVSSLFPKSVHERLFHETEEKTTTTPIKKKNDIMTWMKKQDNMTMANRGTPETPGSTIGSSNLILGSRPIADLFPDATVLFGDIAGFTAWSSAREPSQVFILLETVYGAFDAIADRRRVFKVETIGDCYMAATGLPEPRPNHAIVMARFANDCREKFDLLARELELIIGPDTGNLQMRFGIHSGPVTGGVLRGQKSRFQLFGDTVNTAARMESCGLPGRIQCSQATFAFLNATGKSHWATRRDELVEAKGKGTMTTYWVNPKSSGTASVKSGGTSVSEGSHGGQDVPDGLDEKSERLVDWNTDILARLICQIIARRDAGPGRTNDKPFVASKMFKSPKAVLDEIQEVIELPVFDAGAVDKITTAEQMKLNPIVKDQLRDYIMAIAISYNNLSNKFHNFQHASHVGMAVSKLLSRIVAPGEAALKDDATGNLSKHETQATRRALALHSYSYGITSDPLTQFACVFSALIHDVNHPGVPNGRLAEEHPELASKYRNQSIAEQRSINIAWELLMAPCFTDLREAIFVSEEECALFRKLVVNSVLATDIFDKELGALRKARWEKAFHMATPEKGEAVESTEEDANRKATIVIEYLIQAADVSHTMQHWHVYQDWNHRLFQELYTAYKAGRSKKDPSKEWYQGELWFFDNYVIPLAKKLKECGVFGVSSDEYLSYAMANKLEWEQKGSSIVAKWREKEDSSTGNL